jgi:hypothetical protein
VVKKTTETSNRRRKRRKTTRAKARDSRRKQPPSVKKKPCFLGVGDKGVEHKPVFKSWPSKMLGYEVRETKRWADDGQKESKFRLPFIETKGHFSGVALATVSCEPQQFVASTVSTIASRLRKHCMLHNENHMVYRVRNLIVRSAYYYMVSRNDWFLDRFLVLSKDLKKNVGSISHHLARFISRLDEYNRFVYSQVSFQTNWLFTRALRPRDKSNFFLYSNAGTLCPLYRNSEWRKRAMRHVSRCVTSLKANYFRPTLIHYRGEPLRVTKLGNYLLSFMSHGT